VESSDSALVARLSAGDDRALAEAFDSLGSAVFTAAHGVLRDAAAAQDVVQDVFVDLWSRPGRFDQRLGSLRTYLMLCARHRAQDVVRSAVRRAGREERSARRLPAPRQPTPEEQVADAETRSAVRSALRTLPPDQRELVELTYFGGFSYREVARTLGIPEGTAKSRVRLALAKLGTVLDGQRLERS